MINTHLHFDHCGQNAVFRHAPFCLRRDVLIGDAAYTPCQFRRPDAGDLPSGQASDLDAWRGSRRRIRPVGAGRVPFCHHTEVVRT